MQHMKTPTTMRQIKKKKKRRRRNPEYFNKKIQCYTKLKRAQYMLLKISETPNSIQCMKI